MVYRYKIFRTPYLDAPLAQTPSLEYWKILINGQVLQYKTKIVWCIGYQNVENSRALIKF